MRDSCGAAWLTVSPARSIFTIHVVFQRVAGFFESSVKSACRWNSPRVILPSTQPFVLRAIRRAVNQLELILVSVEPSAVAESHSAESEPTCREPADPPADLPRARSARGFSNAAACRWSRCSRVFSRRSHRPGRSSFGRTIAVNRLTCT